MAIQILPARLANQIAAGEVVERPASVVKELVENSLDAGATRIEIEIEQGGAKCIRIKDNGKGVSKEELTLALSRHATSKISHLDDLEAIVSLGFRGEALASVSSVSRLTFTSKPADQDQAWQAVAEGRDMQVNVQPAAHPQGTTVEVLDLFFNTPARRRFLKTEKTEFQHIDELIKRIALSRFDIAITLKHNKKIVRQYRAAPEQAQQEKRIAAICSEQFIQHAVFFEHADQSLKISGWVSDRLSPRPLADVQYCYINGRMIRDKLVNHAIKQVFAHFIPQGMFPGYIIYIECDAKEVDVNVHPAKHEVRFHQARWVHDFISSTLNSTLSDSSLLSHDLEAQQNMAQPRVAEHAYQPPSQVSEGQGGDYNHAHNSEASPRRNEYSGGTGGYAAMPTRPVLDQQKVGAYCDFVAEAFQQDIGLTVGTSETSKSSAIVKLISVIDQHHLLVQPQIESLSALSENGLLIMSLPRARQQIVASQLFNAWQDGEVISQPLLLPVRFKLSPEMLVVAEQASSLLARLGFTYKFQSQFVIVSQVPAAFRHAPIATILPQLFDTSNEAEHLSSEQQVQQVCDKLSHLLHAQEQEKAFSATEVTPLFDALSSLSNEAFQHCFKQPNLSLLLQGIH
ncbi:DNA mismatch repair endonuclease MutL [Psychromonas sp. B3M02]|uniref:DNA mismatch repair endonuclease MutL n=1 Tax=Psychromonas sp. B3M02 TaxID=2267226 RepID=UPI000DE9C010|nr:DNA mismatch repair endonuclease MutL [Psychromonas sp. B3M02]RBW47201.1 DNA mismatch repair endonuclease MutL [Psychromonas sp. B3M02]